METIKYDKNQLYVAVWMVTYNHSKYIGEAIEGVLKQETSFRYKLFIGEDCSTDDTRQICRRYADAHPDIIELICTETNNMWTNSNNIWEACHNSKARYVAQCEGDDYWTDPAKLQRQVDFLESNSDFSLTFTSAKVLDETGKLWPKERFYPKLDKDVLTIEDFILAHTSIIPTASLVFRNILPWPMPDFYLRVISGDIMLAIMMADMGKAKYFDLDTCIYRIHSGGVTNTERNKKLGNPKLMELYLDLDKYMGFRYHRAFTRRLLDATRGNLIFGAKGKKGIALVRHYFTYMPQYIKYSYPLNLKEFVYYTGVLFCPKLLKFLSEFFESLQG